jgi:hypothetical protein
MNFNICFTTSKVFPYLARGLPYGRQHWGS